jgi:hypothetical protein
MMVLVDLHSEVVIHSLEKLALHTLSSQLLQLDLEQTKPSGNLHLR